MVPSYLLVRAKCVDVMRVANFFGCAFRILVMTLFSMHVVIASASAQILNIAYQQRGLLAAGGHSLMTDAIGRAWSWGNNSDGQLGFVPVQVQEVVPWANHIPVVDNIINLAAGGKHSAFINSSGRIWVCGSNEKGQLGTGSTSGTAVPVQLPAMTYVQSGYTYTESFYNIAAGPDYTMALGNSGRIYVWGDNTDGHLGLGSPDAFITTPTQMTVTQFNSPVYWWGLASGSRHHLATDSGGSIWAWGNNESGQLGIGSYVSSQTPTRVSAPSMRTNQVAAGAVHSLAVDYESAVWAWGGNSQGQLGLGDKNSRVTPQPIIGLTNVWQIACGPDFSLALKNDGTVWAWGANSSGQLGNGTITSSDRPVQVANLTDVIAIAAGGEVGAGFCLALKADGTVLSWGSNALGQLGDATLVMRPVPVSVTSTGGALPVSSGLRKPAEDITGSWDVSMLGAQVRIDMVQRLVRYNQFVYAGDIIGVARVPNSLSGVDDTYHFSGNVAPGNAFDGSIVLNRRFNTRATTFQGMVNPIGTLVGTMTDIVYNDSMSLPPQQTTYQVAANRHSAVLTLSEEVQLGGMWQTSIQGFDVAAQLNAQKKTLQGAPITLLSGNLTVRPEDSPVGGDNYAILGFAEADGRVFLTRKNNSYSYYYPRVYTFLGNTDGVSYTGNALLNGVDYLGNITLGEAPVARLSGLPVALVNQAGTDITVSGEKLTHYRYQIDGGTWSSETPIAQHIVLAGLTDGRHTLAVIGRTAAGTWQDQYRPTTATWTVDTTPPAATLAIQPPATVYASGLTLTLSPGAITYYRYSLDGGAYSALVLAATPITLTGLANGNHTLSLIGLDAAGNWQVTPTVYTWVVSYTPPTAAMPPKVSCGNTHTLALKTDGTVWAWGDNSRGQLGDGTGMGRNTPAPVYRLVGVRDIAALFQHSLALKADGTVWAWGRNNQGQLGDGSTTDRATPVQVIGLSDIVAIAGGEFCSLALKSDGTVWAWGAGTLGQLGDGSGIDRTTPVQVSGLSGVVVISAGHNHGMALKSDGSVWTWGYNAFGQLGDGSTTNRLTPVQVAGLANVTAIAGGNGHSLASKADGTIWLWGDNSYGQLGDGTTARRLVPVKALGLDNVSGVASGSQHSVALKGDGTVWAWGSNGFGEIGDGTLTSRLTPVKVSGIFGAQSVASNYGYTVALKSGQSFWAWGRNSYGALGDGSTINRTEPVQIPGLSGIGTLYASVNAVTAGERHSVSLQSDGTVWAWGYNGHGELGFGDTVTHFTPVQTGSLSGAIGLSSQGSHALALKRDGSIWAWGLNIYGALGDGTNIDSSIPVRVNGLSGVAAVGGGRYHSLALKADGTVWAWGWNQHGNLGDGTTTNSNVPVQVVGMNGCVEVAGGMDHSLALRSDGTVWAWGANEYSQLGDGTTTDRTAPVHVSGLSDVLSISCGGRHSLALKKDGTVWAWGLNIFGELGNGTTVDSGVPVQVGGLAGVVAISAGLDHSLALKSDGTVWAWGVNDYGQLGNAAINANSALPVQVEGLTDVTAISSRFYHSLALKNDGSAWAWGRNTERQLGDGSTTQRSTPIQVLGPGGLGTLSLRLPVPVALPPASITPSGFMAQWTAVFGASGYSLLSATDSGYSGQLGNVTSQNWSGLRQRVPHSYQVRAIVNNQFSEYSNVVVSRVGQTLLLVPVLFNLLFGP